MRIIALGSVLLWLAGAAVAGEARIAREGEHFIALRNELLQVRIDLARGARVASFRYAGFDNEDVVYDYAAGNGGLCKDLWTVQGWPGEFNKRLYEAEILKEGPGEVVVRTWTTSTGEFRNKRQEALSELVLAKTYRLVAGDRALHVKVEVTNQGAKGKRPAYWSQSALDFDGQRKNNRYWRPTRHAVDMIHAGKGSDYGYWYVAVPRAGWNGVTNAKRKRGILFLLDYNSVKQLYDNCAASTVEWMYEDVAIPAGKTWVTEFQLVPTEGYAGYRHGDETVIGYFEAVSTPAGLRIEHTVSATSAPLTDVSVKTRVIGAVEDWVVEPAAIQVETLGFKPLQEAVLAQGVGPMPCVVQVTVTGKDQAGAVQTVFYEDYVGGKAGRNLSLETLEPHYEFAAPPKMRQYLKPDEIKLARPAVPRILFVRGLWATFQGLDEAFAELGEVVVVNGWMKRSALGETLGNFPAAYEELLAYDAIVLANVSGRMLGDVGQEMLADFVKAGGGLLLLSGDRTYGQAGFGNASFIKLLPVTCGEAGDYGRLPGPAALTVKQAHPAVAGWEADPGAIALYGHRLTAAPGAQVVVEAGGGNAALVCSGSTETRVAAVGVLPFGVAPANQRLYYESESWHRLMASTLTWLLRR